MRWFLFWLFMLFCALVALDNFFAQPYYPGFWIGCFVMFSMGVSLAGVFYTDGYALPKQEQRVRLAEEHYGPSDEEFNQSVRGYAASSPVDLEGFVSMVVKPPMELCQQCGRPLNICRAEALDLYLTWRAL